MTEASVGPNEAGIPRARRARALVLAAIAVIAVLLGTLQAPPAAEASPLTGTPRAAAKSLGFDPGRIITDANFYDGTAMTRTQVHAFLKKRVPDCTIGDKGRKAGSKYGSTKIAKVCLRDARFTSKTHKADQFCKKVVGKKHELAAHYIARVGKACNISQKVLLVMMQKEQSIVTDTWPTERQYGFAMGWNCPDTGPNNSANCNSGSAGFTSQVYYGARQLQRYRVNANQYNFQAGKTYKVQYHPNASCGKATVHISNWATAALYVYTPYHPGGKTGCVSYDKTNFVNIHTGWFGSPLAGYSVHSKLKKLHAAHKTQLGRPTAKAKKLGDGIFQDFKSARMYWHPKTGASVVRGKILASYKKNGEFSSKLGAPIGSERKVQGTQNQRFQKGEIFWTAKKGALQVRGKTYTAFKKFGGAAKLGVPSGNMTGTSKSGVMQDFSKKRTITWVGTSKAKLVTGKIRTRYLKSGGVKKIGYAKANAKKTASGGKIQRFSKATIYMSKSGSTKVVFAKSSKSRAAAAPKAVSKTAPEAQPRSLETPSQPAQSPTETTDSTATPSPTQAPSPTPAPTSTPSASTPSALDPASTPKLEQ